MPPPEKWKIFVIIFSFMSCFKKQVLFLLEIKKARGVGGGRVGKEGGGRKGRVFAFVLFSLWFAKKHHQMTNRRNPA